MFSREKHFNLAGCYKKSLSKLRSNNNNPLTPESLIEILKEHKNKIAAISYVHRQNTSNVYGRLVETGTLDIDLTKYLISKRKANDKELIRKLNLFRPPAFLEIKEKHSERFDIISPIFLSLSTK